LLAVLVVATVPVAIPLPATANDKVQHVLAFALLTFLGFRAYPRAAWLLLPAGLALYGALIELIQLVPTLNRLADWRDWVADLGGVAILLIMRWLVARRPSALSSGATASSNAPRDRSPDRTRDP
jgi:hypothetical protein